LFVFFLVAHFSVPKTEKIKYKDVEKSTRKELTNSGRKMVLTTFSSALISELDIVLLGLFYFGPALGVLAWSRRILEIIFQLLAASLDILFPELSRAKDKNEIQNIRDRLKRVFFFSFIIPITFYLLRDTAGNILVSLLGEDFREVSSQTSLILFSLPLMVWSRINIIFSRALGFEVNITKIIISASIISYLVYFSLHNLNISNPAILSIITSQTIISIVTSYSFRKSNV
jgi:O-antigen/teichoic acid export membrane protein